MKTIFLIALIVTSLVFNFTRLQFVEPLVKMVEKVSGEIVVTSCPFVDVPSNSIACKAYQIGVTAGTTKTTFSPSDKIQPYQAFLMVGRALQYLSR